MSEKEVHRTAQLIRLALSTSIRLPIDEWMTEREHWTVLGTLCGTNNQNRTLDPAAVTCKRCRANRWFDGEQAATQEKEA